MSLTFGLVCAGRPVQSDFNPVDAGKWALEIPQSELVNHMTVFTFNPFPAGYAATVHVMLPASQLGWQMLGVLTNEKPSAIFRLAGLRTLEAVAAVEAAAMGGVDVPPAVLGISIEPIETVMQQYEALPSSRKSALTLLHHSSASNIASAPLTTAAGATAQSLATRVLQHLYNYVTSYATTQLPPGAHTVGYLDGGAGAAYGGFGSMAGSAPLTNESWIPVKAFEKWYEAALRKVKMDERYFERESI
ncbi:hypothetical protein BC828DRAFT_371355 [Blastocladiella britannica]|nr:hypothetical protein BC828DRAFT_371355 [Blastocladiella britannica]